MKYLKNKIEKILYQKRYDIEKKEEWFCLKYKNQVLWAFEYITNQKERFWDFDSRWIEKIPKEYINKRVEILILPFSYDEEKSTLNNDIFEKTLGILKNNNLDPVEWQKEIRNEWNK